MDLRSNISDNPPDSDMEHLSYPFYRVSNDPFPQEDIQLIDSAPPDLPTAIVSQENPSKRHASKRQAKNTSLRDLPIAQFIPSDSTPSREYLTVSTSQQFEPAAWIEFQRDVPRIGGLVRVEDGLSVAVWAKELGEMKEMVKDKPHGCAVLKFKKRNKWICFLKRSVLQGEDLRNCTAQWAMFITQARCGAPPIVLSPEFPLAPPVPDSFITAGPAIDDFSPLRPAIPDAISPLCVETNGLRLLQSTFETGLQTGQRRIVVLGFGKTYAIVRLLQQHSALWATQYFSRVGPKVCPPVDPYRTLFVVDDADSPNDVKSLADSGAFVIVSSRNGNESEWSKTGAGFVVVRLPPWTADEGRELLRLKCPQLELDFKKREHYLPCTFLVERFPDVAILDGIAAKMNPLGLEHTVQLATAPTFVPQLNNLFIGRLNEIVARLSRIDDVRWLLDVLCACDATMPVPVKLLQFVRKLKRAQQVSTAVDFDPVQEVSAILEAAESQSLILRQNGSIVLPAFVRYVWPYRSYAGEGPLSASRRKNDEEQRALLMCIEALLPLESPAVGSALMRHCRACLASADPQDPDMFAPPQLDKDLELPYIRQEFKQRTEPRPTDRPPPNQFYSRLDVAKAILRQAILAGVLLLYAASGGGKSTTIVELVLLLRASGLFDHVVYSHRSRIPNDLVLADNQKPSKHREDPQALGVAWNLRMQMSFASLGENINRSDVGNVLESADVCLILDNVTTFYCMELVESWTKKLRSNGRRSCVIIVSRFPQLALDRPWCDLYELPALSPSQAVDIALMYGGQDSSQAAPNGRALLEELIRQNMPSRGFAERYLSYPRPLLWEFVGRAVPVGLAAGQSLDEVLSNAAVGLSQACATGTSFEPDSGVINVDTMISTMMRWLTTNAYKLCRRVAILASDAQVCHTMMQVLCIIGEPLITMPPEGEDLQPSHLAQADVLIAELVDRGFLRKSPEHTMLKQSFFEKAGGIAESKHVSAIGIPMLMWLVHMRKADILKQLQQPDFQLKLWWLHTALYNTANEFDDKPFQYYTMHGLVWRLARNRELGDARPELARSLVRCLLERFDQQTQRVFDYKHDVRLEVCFKVFVAQDGIALQELIANSKFRVDVMFLESWKGDDSRNGFGARHSMLMAILSLTRSQAHAAELLRTILKAGERDPAAMQRSLSRVSVMEQNAAHFAAAKGYDKVLQALIDSPFACALVKAKDRKDSTPLDLAVANDRQECKKLLEEYQRSLSQQDAT